MLETKDTERLAGSFHQLVIGLVVGRVKFLRGNGILLGEGGVKPDTVGVGGSNRVFPFLRDECCDFWYNTK